MGRKKIEIRPLTDERNRNVTFLKRKAGLMKKAWELSVLCAADVSILIFSASGKPYEFASRDLDAEIDRYLDFEGSIERRRAPEFAAMALAGEDDDEDDEDGLPSRRGSSSKLHHSKAVTPAVNGTIGPGKSLKGKETFKARMSSRAALTRATAEAREGDRKGRKGGRKSLVGEILSERSSGSSSQSESQERAGLAGRTESAESPDGQRRRLEDVRGSWTARGAVAESTRPQPQASSGMAGIQYALDMHTNSQPNHASQPTQPSLNSFPNNYQNPVIVSQNRHPHSGYQHPTQQPLIDVSQIPHPAHQQPYLSHNPSYNTLNRIPPTPIAAQPMLPQNMQWDPQLVARFAEYQLHQNHQRQARALLERQRQQLAELGIPAADKNLLDQLFGGAGDAAGGEASSTIIRGEQPFEWPDLSASSGKSHSNRGMQGHPGTFGAEYVDSHRLAWGTAEEGPPPLPSPVSGEEVPRIDKRDRDEQNVGRGEKRNKVS